jgi:hypothetical protein
MRIELMLERIKQYDEFLASYDFKSERLTESNNVRDLDHIRWLLNYIPELIKEGKIEKAHRWYGFIQGVLWAKRIYSTSELRSHNRDCED